MKKVILRNQDPSVTINYWEDCQCKIEALYKASGRAGNEENIVLMADVLLTFEFFDSGYSVSRQVPLQVLIPEIRLKQIKGVKVVVIPEDITIDDEHLMGKLEALLVECHDNYFGRIVS